MTTKLAARRPVKDASERPVQHKRDAAATRQRILQAACKAFAVEGFTGARIDQIAKAAEANVQMIYRYFGGKEELYLAALEATYAHVRSRERELDLAALGPEEGMRRLIEFTFDYLRDNPDFVAIVRNENMIGGRFVRQLPMVSDTTFPLAEAISDLLARGRKADVFKAATDATNLYVTILSLCITHLAQKDTLSVMFSQDLGSQSWLHARRNHVISVVLSFLTAPYQEPAQ